MRNDWRKNLDWLSLWAWLSLITISAFAIYSATHGPASEYLLKSVQNNFYRQLMWAGIGATGIGIALLLPPRFFQTISYPVYVITMLLLVASLVFGREVNGARSWIYIGSIGIQSSELAKVGTILAVARLLSSRSIRVHKVRYAAGAVALILLPAGLIIMQNDTGTALVYLALIPMILFWSGFSGSIIMLMVSPAIAGYLGLVYWPAAVGFTIIFSIIMLFFTGERRFGLASLIINGGVVASLQIAIYKILQPHQLSRILSFVDPEAYRLTSGFHVIQAKAAIGSGGLFGKGFMEGTQTQLAFVPEQSTDFVFCVIGEEWGFVGGMIVLALFGILMIRLLTIGINGKHPFLRMVAAGTVGIYFIHVLINIGMTMGALPVIGIPLPFLSYGGSAMMANTALLAITLSLSMRKNQFSIYV